VAHDCALVAGVRVLDETGRLAERIELSNGLRRVEPDQRYIEGATLAQAPWRAPTAAELRLLERRRAPAPGSRHRPFVVTVTHLHHLLEHPFRIAACEAASSAETWARFKGSSTFEEDLARTSAWALPRHHGEEPPILFSLVRKEAGLASVAYDGACNAHVGLHFDHYDRLPSDRRHTARNRLVLNLGTGPRHLVFVNLPLMRIRRGLGTPWDAPVGNWSAYLLHGLVTVRPDYPAVRLRLDPGDVYIAPTDHLVHDASTELGSAPDVSLHFIGRFA
jgi:hypothetical protein